MKIKEGFVLREVADTYIVIALKSAAVELNGVLSLNASGAMLWQILERGGDLTALADALVMEYEVSREQAMQDAAEFADRLRQAGCLED